MRELLSNRIFVTLAVLLVLGLGVVAISASPVEAQQNNVITRELCNNPDIAGQGACTQDGLLSADGLLYKLLGVFIKVVGGASIIVIVIAGIMFVVSGGDSNQVQRARNAVIYAVVGLAVALVAQGIVSFVINTAA